MTHDSESFSHSTLAGLARILAAQTPVSLMIATLVLVCLGYPTRSAAQSTITCPSGTYDMLDWMTLDSSLRSTYHLEGTSNPLYTVMQPGKFYWVKGGGGYPWDIQLYDSKYIYLWITELSWTVPQSYKKFTNNTNLPLVPRCAIAGTPGSTQELFAPQKKVKASRKTPPSPFRCPHPSHKESSPRKQSRYRNGRTQLKPYFFLASESVLIRRPRGNV